MVRAILESRRSDGLLPPGSSVVTASSGNTGTSLALHAAAMDLHATIVVHPFCSDEKIRHMQAFGAEVFVATHDDYTSLAKTHATAKGSFYLDQYNDQLNPLAYYHSLGPEIWAMTEGAITHFVMTASTGGCISGVSRFLKEQNPSVKTILVDPGASRLWDFFHTPGWLPDASSACGHSIIEGAGKSYKPGCLDFSLIDDVVKIDEAQALRMCRHLAARDGLLVGGSSGLNMEGVKKIQHGLDADSVVVTLLCDSGMKYLSKIFVPDHDQPLS
jgi:cysteine synthase